MSFTNSEVMRQKATGATTTAIPPQPPAEVSANKADASANTVPTARPTPDFEAAAQRIATAEAKLAATEDAARDAAARLDQIGARITELENERAAIVERRQAGDRRDDDAAQVSLLDADLGGLAALRTDAAGVAALAQSAVTTAQREVDIAHQALRLVEDRQAHMLLCEHATKLAGLLHQAVARLLPIEERLNISAARSWAPPQGLIDVVRRAAFGSRGGW